LSSASGDEPAVRPPRPQHGFARQALSLWHARDCRIFAVRTPAPDGDLRGDETRFLGSLSAVPELTDRTGVPPPPNVLGNKPVKLERIVHALAMRTQRVRLSHALTVLPVLDRPQTRSAPHP
jgi:hypothetical protein